MKYIRIENRMQNVIKLGHLLWEKGDRTVKK